MMMKEIISLFFLSIVVGMIQMRERSMGPCHFTHDCRQHCRGVQDASCVCLHGQCLIRSSPRWRWGPPECEDFKDCGCRKNPASCFCIGGVCREESWECRKDQDCKKMRKCRGKECVCRGFLCEHECNRDADCKGFPCDGGLLGKIC